jgi:transcription elongation factor Elf1
LRCERVGRLPIITIHTRRRDKGSTMADIESHLIRFQCPKCGHELEQSIGVLKLSGRMVCAGCGIGINIDAAKLSNAAEEMMRALNKLPPEITIKFFR